MPLARSAGVTGVGAEQLTNGGLPFRRGSDVLAKYVGVYAMAPGVNMMITLVDDQLISQMTGQGKVPLVAQSPTMFFPKVVDAGIEFSVDDATGSATHLILHQNGRDTTGKRLPEAVAKILFDAAAAFDNRLKDQTPGTRRRRHRTQRDGRSTPRKAGLGSSESQPCGRAALAITAASGADYRPGRIAVHNLQGRWTGWGRYLSGPV